MAMPIKSKTVDNKTDKTPMSCATDLYLILSGLSDEELSIFLQGNSGLVDILIRKLQEY